MNIKQFLKMIFMCIQILLVSHLAFAQAEGTGAGGMEGSGGMSDGVGGGGDSGSGGNGESGSPGALSGLAEAIEQTNPGGFTVGIGMNMGAMNQAIEAAIAGDQAIGGYTGPIEVTVAIEETPALPPVVAPQPPVAVVPTPIAPPVVAPQPPVAVVPTPIAPPVAVVPTPVVAITNPFALALIARIETPPTAPKATAPTQLAAGPTYSRDPSYVSPGGWSVKGPGGVALGPMTRDDAIARAIELGIDTHIASPR